MQTHHLFYLDFCHRLVFSFFSMSLFNNCLFSQNVILGIVFSSPSLPTAICIQIHLEAVYSSLLFHIKRMEVNDCRHERTRRHRHTTGCHKDFSQEWLLEACCFCSLHETVKEGDTTQVSVESLTDTISLSLSLRSLFFSCPVMPETCIVVSTHTATFGSEYHGS